MKTKVDTYVILHNNDRVRLTYWHERVGVVFRAGEEQSEVKWNDGYTLNHLNEHLEKISGSPVAYRPPPTTKAAATTPTGKVKLIDALAWRVANAPPPFKAGTGRYVQWALARTTCNMVDFKAGGGNLEYLKWFFKQGYVEQKK